MQPHNFIDNINLSWYNFETQIIISEVYTYVNPFNIQVQFK